MNSDSGSELEPHISYLLHQDDVVDSEYPQPDNQVLNIDAPIMPEAQDAEEPLPQATAPRRAAAPAVIIPLDVRVDFVQTEVVSEQIDVAVVGESVIAAVLGYALMHEYFRIEDMHRDVPILAAMTKAEYVRFKEDFLDIRNKITQLLGASDVEGVWAEIGRTRGKKYGLVIESGRELVDGIMRSIAEGDIQTSELVQDEHVALQDAVIEAIEDVTTPVQEAEITAVAEVVQPDTAGTTEQIVRSADYREQRRAEVQEFLAAVNFTRRLTAGIVAILQEKPQQTEKISLVARTLSERLEITQEAAREVLSQLVSAELLYTGKPEKGSKTISVEPYYAEQQPEKLSQAEKNAIAEASDNSSLSEAEILEAVRVIEYLIRTFDHVQQGETVKMLILRLQPAMDEKEFRAMLRKLVARRYITLGDNNNFGRGRKGALVKIRSQDFKNRWKGSKEGILVQMQSAVEEKASRSR